MPNKARPTGDGRRITVNSRKYDGKVRRTWTGGIVSESDDLIVLVGRFEFDVLHNDIGSIREGTVSFEHYWLDRWYNVFRFHEPDGALKCYYCNVAMPPTFDGLVIDYVDLDIDVITWPDKTREILDLDDFERNTIKFGYPDDIRGSALTALDELAALIDADGLP